MPKIRSSYVPIMKARQLSSILLLGSLKNRMFFLSSQQHPITHPDASPNDTMRIQTLWRCILLSSRNSYPRKALYTSTYLLLTEVGACPGGPSTRPKTLFSFCYMLFRRNIRYSTSIVLEPSLSLYSTPAVPIRQNHFRLR